MSKKEAVVETKSRLKEEVLVLSGKVRESIECDKTSGVIAIKEGKDPFYDNLPEGLTKEGHQQYSDYGATFVAATAHATGLEATEAMRKNKSLNTVTSEFPMGKDVTRHSVERHREYSFGTGADRKEIEKYGVMRSEVDIKGGRKAAQLKIVHDEIGRIATENFGSKK